MAKLEQLIPGNKVNGLTPDGSSAIVEKIDFYGTDAAQVIYRDGAGIVREKLLYRADEANLNIVEAAMPWSFDADGDLLRLASEAYRIRLAHIFDPFVAIETSLIRPLPHQITAVYGEMLNRHPLRFLLADDPGAGKTIMAGLLFKELMLRGDLERCLIIPPGSLVEQWQDELDQKFGLHFDILTRDSFEAARTGNPFEEKNFCIARLDQLSRNEEYQEKLLKAPEWDLIVVDEAHKMSASWFGNELKRTARYRLGMKIGSHTRHLLLMTATPHNGHEADFQAFLALIDTDRFEGKFNEGVHTSDPSDMMRRLVKEELLTFEGKPLFPERRAYTVAYDLSDEEAALYNAVTEYVRDEMNRAERFADEDNQRRVNVGFALTILQRRLASSPRAIHRSLERRLQKLQERLAEEKLLAHGEKLAKKPAIPKITPDWLDDLEDAPEEEVTETEDVILDQATAAATIQELEIEIETLVHLEQQARWVMQSETDTKWTELRTILDHELMVDQEGNRRKLLIFTEARDTLEYLQERIASYLGQSEAVAVIHGGVKREWRRNIIKAFNQDKNLKVLVANDAAGEGVNLQRSHLMVNYDLPWNPNRLEQRFGRIHRIGQTEVCHCWNLIAHETREGAVYTRLLEKLETERKALGGKVYDVLGKLFEKDPLRDLLVSAIRYGDDPEVKAKLDQVIDGAVDRQHVLKLLEDRALVQNSLTPEQVNAVREEMERARTRRLHPHFVQSFFLEAFKRLGGQIAARESDRFEILRVPPAVRDRDRLIGTGAAVRKTYERITFHKDRVDQTPAAEFVYPGHPLMDSVTDLILEQYKPLLRRGAILVDDNDDGDQPRLLFFLEQSIQDGRVDRHGNSRVISRAMHFVEANHEGELSVAGAAPYLDYRAIHDDELELVSDVFESDWLKREWEKRILAYAIAESVPAHLENVKAQKLPLLQKTEEEITARLRKEINLWDARAEDLRLKEQAGKKTKLSARNAEQRAEDLLERLERRRKELDVQRMIAGQPPQVKGGILIIPRGMIAKASGDETDQQQSLDAAARKAVELAAMNAVFAAERKLGRKPRDVSAQRGIGYDIESRNPDTGDLFFIEVKGKGAGKNEVTLTRTELFASRNHPERWRLALVVVDGENVTEPRYLIGHTFAEPDFAESQRTYKFDRLLADASKPE